MRRILIAGLSLALVGCAHDLPPIQTRDVFVPVMQPCKTSEKLGPEPDYADTLEKLAAVPHPDAVARLRANPLDAAALLDELENTGSQLKSLLSGRAQRIQRDKEKSAALKGCESDINHPPPS